MSACETCATDHDAIEWQSLGMVCSRCGQHTGNNHQGHYWGLCKVLLGRGVPFKQAVRELHFCCPGDCALEARPKRIQRKRTKGWKMPDGAIYVGRPTVWGNPWAVSDDTTAEQAVELHRAWTLNHEDRADAARNLLAGKDLACWCPLDQPCHADVLLELANKETK